MKREKLKELLDVRQTEQFQAKKADKMGKKFIKWKENEKRNRKQQQ